MKIITYRTLGILSAMAFGTIGWLPFVQLDTDTEVQLLRRVRAEEAQRDRFAFRPAERVAGQSRGSTGLERDASPSTMTFAEGDPHAVLKKKVDLLEKGYTYLQEKPDYTAMLTKQEVVQGQLLDEQRILLKCRHKPFSVYLNWHQGDVGREVIYVEGKHNGRMIAHDGGWKSRIPAFFLEPDCALAMSGARYPITSAGLLGLVETMLKAHQEDLTKLTVKSCSHLEDGELEGRPCHVFQTTYKSREISPTYRKSITLIDKEWNVPCLSKHYEWPAKEGADEAKVDEVTLIELYHFSEIRFDQSLSDSDFDSTNPEYRFR
ncbi:DUF1571 domain-containing protein [Schlesneria sp.]|uniref:DUF1571 domain-containing protein n=1 Tax=Schlesneria sp. TaxID=2762018 RepID=UPI002EE5561C